MEFGTLKIGNGNLENKGMSEICQPRTILHQKHTLRSVRLGYANVNLMKAIFGFAWAVAEWVFILFLREKQLTFEYICQLFW